METPTEEQSPLLGGESPGPDAAASPTQESKLNMPEDQSDGEEPQYRPSDFLPTLAPQENAFFQLVEDGDCDQVEQFLNTNAGINVNCHNFQGLTPLHVAVKQGNEPVVRLLLKAPDIDMADTVLYGVQENHIRIVSVLLEKLQHIDPDQEFFGYERSSRYSTNITAMILAARANQYEMVRFLKKRGHQISTPHQPDCSCREVCGLKRDGEELGNSFRRVTTYQALASPAYIIQTSHDPVNTCFLLHEELAKNIEYESEFRSLYEEIQQQLRQFVVQFLNYCRSTEEVELILSRQHGCDEGTRPFHYPRLLMAIDYEQKEFVTHPKVQQVLTNLWLGQRQSWRRYNFVQKLLTFTYMTLLLPVSVLMMKLYPHSDRVRFWHSPINKWMNWVASYITFLALIVLETSLDETTQTLGPPDSGLEPFIVFWVLGLTVAQVKQCWRSGWHRYASDPWHLYDTLITVAFMLSFGCWGWAYYDVATYGSAHLERKFWYKYDPTLLGEGFIAMASILAFGKTLYLFQMSSSLGPLQISLGKMLLDIGQFLVIFLLFILSFASGMSRLYTYYKGMERVDGSGVKSSQSDSFVSLINSCSTLFWALFGIAPLQSVDVVVENLPGGPPQLPIINKHNFTETVGYTMFAVFHVICVVILMNMLIAVMSDTFEAVNESADIEWKFARTRLWVAFIMEPPVPPPFNLLPSAEGVWSALRWCQTCLLRPVERQAGFSLRRCCYTQSATSTRCQPGGDDPAAFKILMAVLAQRYFRDTRHTQRQTPARQRDTQGLLQQLDSLKTELRANQR